MGGGLESLPANLKGPTKKGGGGAGTVGWAREPQDPIALQSGARGLAENPLDARRRFLREFPRPMGGRIHRNRYARYLRAEEILVHI